MWVISLVKLVYAEQSSGDDVVNVKRGAHLLTMADLACVIIALAYLCGFLAPVVRLSNGVRPSTFVHTDLTAIFTIAFFDLMDSCFVVFAASLASESDVRSILEHIGMMALLATIMLFAVLHATWVLHVFFATRGASQFNFDARCSGLARGRTILSFCRLFRWQRKDNATGLTGDIGASFNLTLSNRSIGAQSRAEPFARLAASLGNDGLSAFFALLFYSILEGFGNARSGTKRLFLMGKREQLAARGAYLFWHGINSNRKHFANQSVVVV